MDSYSGPRKSAERHDFMKFHPFEYVNIRKYRSRHEGHDSDNQNVPGTNLDSQKSIFHFDTPLKIGIEKVMILAIESHDSRIKI